MGRIYPDAAFRSNDAPQTRAGKFSWTCARSPVTIVGIHGDQASLQAA
jgi:hypothetical protein